MLPVGYGKGRARGDRLTEEGLARHRDPRLSAGLHEAGALLALTGELPIARLTAGRKGLKGAETLEG
jgi:hypothetical protein